MLRPGPECSPRQQVLEQCNWKKKRQSHLESVISILTSVIIAVCL